MKKPHNKKTIQQDMERLKSLVSPSSDESPLDCAHGTELGAFIVYSIKEVDMELFYYSNEENEVKTEKLHAVWDINQKNFTLNKYKASTSVSVFIIHHLLDELFLLR